MGFLPKIQALKLSPCDVLLFMSDVTPELLAVNGSKQPRGILFSYNQGMFCRGGFKAQTFPYPYLVLILSNSMDYSKKELTVAGESLCTG